MASCQKATQWRKILELFTAMDVLAVPWSFMVPGVAGFQRAEIVDTMVTDVSGGFQNARLESKIGWKPNMLSHNLSTMAFRFRILGIIRPWMFFISPESWSKPKTKGSFSFAIIFSRGELLNFGVCIILIDGGRMLAQWSCEKFNSCYIGFLNRWNRWYQITQLAVYTTCILIYSSLMT